ncbi:MAG TPA: PaaI family thioesterase, partial [Solirubrobacterales bacterium]|nr:PaaI family thioesterase [Solirubrobacterales bacterium]
RCFGCGALNEEGLRLHFEPPDGEGVVRTRFTIPPRYQSWAGVVHGGVVALLLDEAVGWAAWHAGQPGVTGRLEVRFRQPLKVGEEVEICGRLERSRRSLAYVSAWVSRVADGALVAEGSATLMAVEVAT